MLRSGRVAVAVRDRVVGLARFLPDDAIAARSTACSAGSRREAVRGRAAT
jgi:hypothetical protein